MKIKSIKKVGRKNVYDISVKDVHHYVLENGAVTHNSGLLYSANQAFIISKSQEKDDEGLAGWKFTINIEKSRYVREKAKLPFKVLYNDGIQKWSSLFELAQEAGFIIKPKMGWYQTVDTETGEISEKSYRAKNIENDSEYFGKLIKDKKFNEFIEKKFKLSGGMMDANIDHIAEFADVDESDPMDEDD